MTNTHTHAHWQEMASREKERERERANERMILSIYMWPVNVATFPNQSNRNAMTDARMTERKNTTPPTTTTTVALNLEL